MTLRTIESIDDREERIQALGKTGGVFYLVVYTSRDGARHIITAWKVFSAGPVTPAGFAARLPAFNL